MNRSQLRRLARDYATGRLEYDEYVRERGELIDAIESGTIAIESSADSTADFPAARSLDQRIRSTPLPLILGACAIIAVVWVFLVPSQTKPPPIGGATVDKAIPGKRVSAARALVEEFLVTRDWSSQSLGAFRENWNALTPNEQAEARASSWFRRLAEALREEINAHKALAEFDGSGLSTTTGRRLASFGEFLGIDAQLPDPFVQEKLSETTARDRAPLTASQWLAAQDDDGYTLQLFAVDHLDQLEHIIAEHPDIPLYLFAFEGREPRYRILHGAFTNEQQARGAHQALPADLRGASSEPFVRRIAEIREELRGASHEAASRSPVANETAPVYTLQLFASQSRENVDRLLARYHSLDLRVHTSHGRNARYRVLYGNFESREAAHEAAGKLPAAMLEEVGTPLLRETSEFR